MYFVDEYEHCMKENDSNRTIIMAKYKCVGAKCEILIILNYNREVISLKYLDFFFYFAVLFLCSFLLLTKEKKRIPFAVVCTRFPF